MLRRVLAAIVAALRGLMEVLAAMFALPMRAVDSLFGGGGGPTVAEPPAGHSPRVRDLKKELSDVRVELRQAHEKMVPVVIKWCGDSLVADLPLETPKSPRVNTAVSGWLQGLTREECTTLVCATKEEVFEHISGIRTIAGVRPVQRLDALEAWPPAPPPVSAPSGFLAAMATLDELEQPSAA